MVRKRVGKWQHQPHFHYGSRKQARGEARPLTDDQRVQQFHDQEFPSRQETPTWGPPPPFLHSSISFVTMHLARLFFPRMQPSGGLLLCVSSLPFSHTHRFIFSWLRTLQESEFDLLGHTRDARCQVEALSSSKCQQQTENRCALRSTTTHFSQLSVFFGSASKPERVKNLWKHVIL